jgi:purine nucleoside phosphorylase
MFQGRFHFMKLSNGRGGLSIRVLAALGIKNLIVTNASGSLKEKLGPGTICRSLTISISWD